MRKGTYTHIVMAALAAAIIGVVFASVALSQHQSKITTSIPQKNINKTTTISAKTPLHTHNSKRDKWYADT